MSGSELKDIKDFFMMEGTYIALERLRLLLSIAL